MNDVAAMGAWAVWAQADAVGKGAALLLLAMSVATWYLILAKGWMTWRVRRESARVQAAFWEAPDLDAAMVRASRSGSASPFLHVAQAALVLAGASGGATARAIADDIDDADTVARVLRAGLQRARRPLDSGLALLASIGATAPFIGLFGTVWGIYHALVGIGMSGQASIEKVAGPVGEALIMTALGIAVAVPAVLAYNFLLRANRVIYADLDGFAHDLRSLLLARRGAARSAPSPAGGA